MPAEPRDLERLAVALGERLGVRLQAAVTDAPWPRERLSPAERATVDGFVTEARRAAWLRGRAALKRVAAALGEDPDTSRFRFPGARVSLSHSAGLAVAVGLLEPAHGIGVDLERGGSPRRGAARFFAAPSEAAYLDTLPEPAGAFARLRLWTVKEALWKSDPGNAGRSLAGYRVEDPRAAAGRAEALHEGDRGRDPEVPCFAYASAGFEGGALSLALCRVPQPTKEPT